MPAVEPQGHLRKEVHQMVYDLSPGDVIHIGETVTVTLVAVEGNLIHFGLESPEGECPDTGLDDRHQGGVLGRCGVRPARSSPARTTG